MVGCLGICQRNKANNTKRQIPGLRNIAWGFFISLDFGKENIIYGRHIKWEFCEDISWFAVQLFAVWFGLKERISQVTKLHRVLVCRDENC